MPTRFLVPYILEMPALVAERSLMAAETTAVGSATLKPADSRAIVRRWRSALPSSGPALPRDAATLAGAARLAGIGFRRVPGKSKPA